MAFEPTSRYAGMKTATVSVPDGSGGAREVTYVLRRFLPPPGAATALARHTVVQGDRLDTIAARYLGDPLQFWRICDAEGAMDPFELTSEPGRTLVVPVPEPARPALPALAFQPVPRR
jgi:hypothetical protein